MAIEIREITRPSKAVLMQIGRLRVDAWAAEIPAARQMQVWIDDRDEHAIRFDGRRSLQTSRVRAQTGAKTRPRDQFLLKQKETVT